MDIALDPLDTGRHRPGAVIVRRRAAARQAADREHRERMIRFLVQQVYSEALCFIAPVMFRSQPGRVEDKLHVERRKTPENLLFIAAVAENRAQILDVLRQAVSLIRVSSLQVFYCGMITARKIGAQPASAEIKGKVQPLARKEKPVMSRSQIIFFILQEPPGRLCKIRFSAKQVTISGNNKDTMGIAGREKVTK